jgi:hypothetical protein
MEAVVKGISFPFVWALFDGERATGISFDGVGPSASTVSSLLELVFAFFKDEGVISPSSLHEQIQATSVSRMERYRLLQKDKNKWKHLGFEE